MKLSHCHLSLSLIALTSAIACSGGGADTSSDLGEGGASGDSDETSGTGGTSADKSGEDALGGSDAGGAPGSDDDIGEDEALKISSYPADGEYGFYNKDDLTVTFSEPMDPDSVDAALSSETLGKYELTWNDDFTELTIDPDSFLEFFQGSDPDALDHYFYDFSIDASATTAQGEALEAEYSVKFAVANRIFYELSPVASLSGYVLTNDLSGATVYAGDSGLGEEPKSGDDWWYTGLLTFDSEELPGEIVQVAAARIDTNQDIFNGTPFASLGARVDVYDTKFEARSWSDVEDDIGEDPVAVFSEDDGDDIDLKVQVGDSFIADYEADRLSQFALRFVLEQNNDEASDTVRYQNTTMRVTYFAM